MTFEVGELNLERDIWLLGTSLPRMLRYVARKMCHYVVVYSSSRLQIFTVYHMVRIIEYFTLYTAICRVYDVKSASVVGGSKSFCVFINPCIVNRRLSRSNNLVRRNNNDSLGTTLKSPPKAKTIRETRITNISFPGFLTKFLTDFADASIKLI